MLDGTNLLYLHADHLGGTALTTYSSTGTTQATQSYYAFGSKRGGGALPTDRQYTGQQKDKTGLYYYSARYYDPALGQFVSPDTIVPDPTVVFDHNRYMMVRGNPLKYNDPTGHQCEMPGETGGISDNDCGEFGVGTGGPLAGPKGSGAGQGNYKTVSGSSSGAKPSAPKATTASPATTVPKQLPSVVTRATGGNGLPKITGQWLRGSSGNAGRVPGQIADKLRGKEFKNWTEFRETFWKTVAKDKNLGTQFTKSNLNLMKQGKAPYAPLNQQTGAATQQKVYNLHHIRPRHDGGGIYNLDNIQIVTPRYHLDTLSRGYHFRGR